MNDNTINDDMTMGGATGTLLAGRYRVVRQLGQGGMGSVWLAEDVKLDGFKVAIKMLPSILVNNKRAYAQVKAEALVSLKLSHPNIATVRAFEEENGNPFLVMDYIDGQTLDDYLAEKGTLTEAETVKLLKPVAAALDYAHTQGVVHRDVKPGNIMIRKDGTPFVLDFGIAREIQETMTRVTGKLSSGTLLYMSPEQLNGDAPKPAQDIYSFAAMAYECLKGEPPFSRGQVEFQILNKDPEPLPGGAALAKTILRGLLKDPAARPAACRGVVMGNVLSPTVEAKKFEKDACGAEPPRQEDSLPSELKAFELSVEVKRVAESMSRLSAETRGIFASDLRAFETDWQAGSVAMDRSRYASAGQLFTRALAKAESLGAMSKAREEYATVREEAETRRKLANAALAQDACPKEFGEADEQIRLAAKSFGERDFISALNFVREAAKSFEAIKDKAETILRVQPGDEKTIILPGGESMTFCWCPATTSEDWKHISGGKDFFLMGSPEFEKGRNADEMQHEVFLTKGFWMGKYEVTQRQWESVMGRNPSHFKGDSRPVENVSWDECQCFIRKINSGGEVAVALPTEAQWEYACRAGTTTTFNFGSVLNGDGANCDGTHPYGTTQIGRFVKETMPVGSYPPNNWGLCDMHGNVWEWCADWYGKRFEDSHSSVDPEGPVTGNHLYRVYRGGGWCNFAQYCRAAHRGWLELGYRWDLGLRLVCLKDARCLGK